MKGKIFITAVSMLIPGWIYASVFDASDIAQRLEEIRAVSYVQHWQDAQAMLDELAPHVDDFQARDQVEFHLLEARHLALADRNHEALERATELLDGPLDDDHRLRLLQFVANVAVLVRDYEMAFDHLRRALEIEGIVDDPVSSIATLNMASYLYGRVGEYERAIDYGANALRLALEAGKAVEECVSRQRLAPVLKWAKMEARAEFEYRSAIEICRASGNKLFVGVLQHGLADLLRREGRLEEARETVMSSIAVLEESTFPLGLHEARLILAEVQADMGEEVDEVDERLQLLSNYFRQRELWDQVARLEQLKAELAVRRGNADIALEHFRAHLQASEEFLSRDRAMRLAYLQVEFDTRLKEQQIELLEEGARVAQLESDTMRQQQRARTIILGLSALTVVLLTAILVRTFRARRHFRDLSRKDHLSGLANHAWFFERAEKLIARATEEGEKAFLVMADIDHFKSINDCYGHLMGDQVLGQTARRLKESFGRNTLTGRIGGEEFAVLAWRKSLEDLVGAVEHFRSQTRLSVREGDPGVTVSFGICQWQPGETLTSLRERTDVALYRAKQAGRDRYVIDDR